MKNVILMISVSIVENYQIQKQLPGVAIQDEIHC